MDDSRARLEHLRADPRVSLTVLDDDWYRHVSLQRPRRASRGRRRTSTDIDRHLPPLPRPGLPDRDSPRFSAWIEIDTLARVERLS